MAAKTFSDGYKLLCRFFKQIGFYHEFLEYQRNTKYYRTIPFDSSSIIVDFGCSSITHWFKHEKNIDFKIGLYYAFRKWLNVFYQEKYGNNIIYPHSNKDDDSCIIDRDKKTIKLKYVKC